MYNIEVHGEHVYEVGQIQLLVHNAVETCLTYVKKVLARHPDGVVFQMHGKNGFVGMLPEYADGARTHFFHLKDGILRDDKFRTGIPINDWLELYARKNNLPLSSILDEIFFSVFK